LTDKLNSKQNKQKKNM